MQIPADNRRDMTSISWKDTKLEIKEQFKKPDNSLLQKWVTLCPLLCALVGVILAVIKGAWDTYEQRNKDRLEVSSLSCFIPLIRSCLQES